MAKRTQDKLDSTLKFISEFIKTHSYPPTVREICSGVGVSSSATAQYYLNRLEKLGKIKRSSLKNRAIEIVCEKESPLFAVEDADVELIPLIGKVTAGAPILAVENVEGNLALPKTMFKKTGEELFALNVSGDSMINAGILNGDKIVVKKQSTAKNGDIVVALIDDSATVKRFYKEKDVFRLQPENDYMKPIFVKELDIVGIVVGLIRKF